ncbi:MAG: hemerythrin domain-containing protein, partial [Chloroflexota bacterium]
MYTPKKLTWSDRLSTGDADIDEQHRFLISTFNELGAAIQHGHGTENVNRILGVLGHYAAWHFTKEEECMARHRCIASDINRKAHAIFVEKFTTYRKEYD